jgi:hypothetical protein
MTPLNFAYFGSNSTHRDLSNLAAATVTLTPGALPAPLLHLKPQLAQWLTTPTQFPSIEHIWQGCKARDKNTFMRFAAGGDFAAWDPAFFGKTTAPKKRGAYAKRRGMPTKDLSLYDIAELSIECMKRWSKYNLIGIMAKLASNADYAKALGLVNKMDFQREFLDPADEEAIWLCLLRLKYANNPGMRQKLLDTGARTLVEFDKGAARRGAHWGGLIKNGILYGDNVMGKYLMHVREEMAQ